MSKTLHGILLLILSAAPLPAQAVWTLTGETATNRFSRAAHDTSSPAVSLGAWRSSSYALHLARESGDSRLALTAGYTSSPLGAWIENVAVIQGGELALFEVGLTLGRRVARTAVGAALRLEAGPVYQLWTMSGEDPRSRLGGLLGAALALPLSSAWRTEVRADLTLTRSWLRPEDEVDGITRERTMRRGRLALGLTRRL